MYLTGVSTDARDALLDIELPKPGDLQAQTFANTVQLGGASFTYEYSLWPRQVEFLTTRQRFVCFGGARGPGKTAGLVRHIDNTMVKYPGIPILICRKDLKDLKRSFEPEWRKWIDPRMYSPKFGGQYHKSERWYRYPNGSVLMLGELKDWESYKSMTLGRIYLEEANEIEEEAVINLEPTLRWTTGKGDCDFAECRALPEYRPHAVHPFYQMVMATNPSPGWIKNRFWQPWHDEKNGVGRQLEGHAFIPATAFDNPSLPPDFIPNLMRHNNATWVRNYIYGDWSAFENMVWPTFNRGVNCWKDPLPLDQVLRIEGGIDYGGTTLEAHRTAAYLTAELRGGRFVTFWEYSQQGAASKDFFATLKVQQQRFKVNRWHADSSQHRANELARGQGLPVFDADRNKGAVKDGINQVHRMLSADNARRAPELYVVESACPRLLSGIETYKLDPLTGEPEKNQEDDEVNAWRYNLMGITGGRAARSDWDQKRVPVGGSAPAKASKHLTNLRDERRERLRAWMAAAEAEEASLAS